MLHLYRTVIGLIAGIGLLVVGTLNLAQSEVKCGAEVMQPNGTCVTTRRGTTTERSYDEQRAYNRRVGVYSTAGGVVVTLASGVFLMGAVRKRRAASQAAVPAARA